MKFGRFEQVAIVVALLVLVGIGWISKGGRQVQVSTYSTYDSGRNGYRALYAVLRAEHVSVSRFQAHLGLLPRNVRTLVISTWRPEKRAHLPYDPLDHASLVRLKEFVAGGGRLVLLSSHFGGAGAGIIGVPGTVRIAARSRNAVPIERGPLLQGVSRARVVIRSLFGFAIPKAAPLLATAHGSIAITYPLGKGQVIAICAPKLFGNAWIARADNARFAVDLFAGHGAVAFDERVHGYVADESFWSVLPRPVHVAIFIVLAIVVLGLIGANIRSMPPISLNAPDERSNVAYVDAMAGVLRRAHAARYAVRLFAADALVRARRRFGLAAECDAEQIVPRIERSALRLDLADLSRRAMLDRPGDEDVLRAADAYVRLRKEFR
ncbi:MAG: DUF4350 domain-containing protein [Vulcanimicrobiaceae bacterium]